MLMLVIARGVGDDAISLLERGGCPAKNAGPLKVAKIKNHPRVGSVSVLTVAKQTRK